MSALWGPPWWSKTKGKAGGVWKEATDGTETRNFVLRTGVG